MPGGVSCAEGAVACWCAPAAARDRSVALYNSRSPLGATARLQTHQAEAAHQPTGHTAPLPTRAARARTLVAVQGLPPDNCDAKSTYIPPFRFHSRSILCHKLKIWVCGTPPVAHFFPSAGVKGGDVTPTR